MTYLYLVAILLYVRLVQRGLNPVSPAVTQCRVIVNPFIFQLEPEVCIDGEY
jgi:hypothetical protein